MWGIRNSGMETVRTQQNSAAPIIFGIAEQTTTVSMAASNKTIVDKSSVNETTHPIVVTKTTYGRNIDSPLKDLSISQILKLAEDHARVTGIGRRTIDNPWFKRMTVSDNITRPQTLSTSGINHHRIGSIATKDEIDDNDEFFENLMKKMTIEQFMPYGKTGKSRKRTRLWNKENSNTSNATKRYKDSKVNTRSIPPTMELFTRRLLPQRNNDNSPAEAMIQSPHEAVWRKQLNQTVPHHRLTLELNQKYINKNEFDFPFVNYNSSSATTMSIDEHFHGNQVVDDCISTCVQETVKLRDNRFIDTMGHDFIHQASPKHYHANKYPKNFWGSPCFSTIEEYREMHTVVKSEVLDTVDTAIDTFLRLTPPSPTQSVDCNVCSLEKEENNNMNNTHTSRQFLPLTILGNSDREIVGILDENLFT